MISSIFGKTKPINYIILFTFLFVLYWLVHYFIFKNAFSVEFIGVNILVLAALLFSIFIVDFIVKRNKLTDVNSFSMLFYALLIVVFIESLQDVNAILCSLFLLLATRRLISIRSLKDIKLKIFDATFWIIVSSLFYEWAILYLILVFTAIYIYEPKNIRNWLVPLTGIFVVFMISYAVSLLLGNPNYLFEHYNFSIQLNTAYFLEWSSSSKRIVYLVLTLCAIVLSLLKLGSLGVGKVVTMRLLAFSFIIGILIDLFTDSVHSHPIIITFFPSVVFMTNYIERIKKANIKEVILILSIFIPFMVLITRITLQ